MGLACGIGIAGLVVFGWQAMSIQSRADAYDRMARKLAEDPAGLLYETGGDALVDKALQGVIDRGPKKGTAKASAATDPSDPFAPYIATSGRK